MTPRPTINKKIRFEIFKRDKFTCQYCGRSAPDVILQIDHIHPVAKDGDNDITNLITACFDCNIGKKDRELSDDAVIRKRKKQLDELQERREQLEMMVTWQRSLTDLDEKSLEETVRFWEDLTPNWYLNESGKKDIRDWLKRYGLSEVLESMRICADQYLRDENGNITQETIDKAFNYIVRVARNRKYLEQNPYMSQLYYIRGILKRRGFYIGYDAMDYLKKAYFQGYDFEYLKRIALEARHWTDWRNTMADLVKNGDK